MSLRLASAVSSLGLGRWSAEIAPGWDIVGAANGGDPPSLGARGAPARPGGPRPFVAAGAVCAGRPKGVPGRDAPRTRPTGAPARGGLHPDRADRHFSPA